MTRIGKIYLYSFVAIVVIVVTSDESWAQQEEVANPDWTTGLWMAAPGAIMGLVNLALVSRLASPTGPNRGGIFDGFSRFFPGLSPEGQKKMMLFMGKHNVQVSNYKDNNSNEEFDDEDCDDCDDDDDEEDEEDDNGDDGEEGGNDKDKGKDKGKYKNKDKKGKNGKYQNNKEKDYEEDDDKYKKPKNSGYSEQTYEPYSAKPYGYNPMEGMDLKAMMIKSAMAAQYPNIDQSQVYWPQTDESMNTGYHTEPSEMIAKSNAPMIVGIPKKLPTKGNAMLPVFKQTTSPSAPMTPLGSGFRPISDFKAKKNNERSSGSSFGRNKYDDDSRDEFRYNNVESEPEEQYNSYDQNNQNNDNFQNEEFVNEGRDFDDDYPQRTYRRKRSTNDDNRDDNTFSNRAGNVPPQRISAKNSTKSLDSLDKITPEMVRLLLSAVNSNAKNDKKSDEKSIKKSLKKSNKKKSKADSMDGEVQTKSSSNRVVTSTKLSVKESGQPVKYLPLDQYKNILNYSADRKQDNPSGRRRRRRNRGRGTRGGDEEEDNENENGDDEDDGEEDDDEDDDLFGDDIPEEGHTTIQIIEKPDEKFNVGIGGWMKRMFTFRSGGRRRGFFSRGNI